jgi:cytochrome o ubiquinol oxidase subunit IV
MAAPDLVVRTVEKDAGSLRSYVIGFVSAVVLTLAAFGIVNAHSLGGNGLVALLLGLAMVQFIVQMVFFLHVGHEAKPRWKQLLLIMMVVFAVILVLGSIWVMYSLDYRMSPEQINTYMLKQDGGI